MPDMTQGKENLKYGTQISRRNVLIGGAAMAGAALPAATFAADTKAVMSTSPNPT